MVGAAAAENNAKNGSIRDTRTNGLTYTGTMVRTGFFSPDFFAQYEKDRIMVAAEFARKPYSEVLTLTSGPSPSLLSLLLLPTKDSGMRWQAIG